MRDMRCGGPLGGPLGGGEWEFGWQTCAVVRFSFGPRRAVALPWKGFAVFSWGGRGSGLVVVVGVGGWQLLSWVSTRTIELTWVEARPWYDLSCAYRLHLCHAIRVRSQMTDCWNMEDVMAGPTFLWVCDLRAGTVSQPCAKQ